MNWKTLYFFIEYCLYMLFVCVLFVCLCVVYSFVCLCVTRSEVTEVIQTCCVVDANTYKHMQTHVMQTHTNTYKHIQTHANTYNANTQTQTMQTHKHT